MDEYPIAVIPDELHWSENFALAAFDPATGIDVFLHVGRWRKDTSLWREMVVVTLPDGSVIAHRAIGSANSNAQGPGGPNFRVDVVEPGARFRYTFLGGARHLAADDLRDRLLDNGPMERVELDLEFTGVAPIWDLGKVGHATDFMGRGHVEQLGRVEGFINVGAVRHRISTIGNRDHSRGVRVNDKMIRHIWMHGIFENGVSFMAYEGEVPDQADPAYSEVCLVKDGKILQASIQMGSRLPMSGSRDHIRDELSFSISSDDGDFQIVAKDFPITTYFQQTYPNDLYVGTRQDGSSFKRSWIEQGVSFVMNGSVRGYGHMERTLPGELIIDPH